MLIDSAKNNIKYVININGLLKKRKKERNEMKLKRRGTMLLAMCQSIVFCSDVA